MKLIACHINNFGKLSDLNINFNDGVNVINQPNGWGKSTLAAFLKAMLYGFDTKKEPGAFERERKLYKPWQGGTYGGELDFEADGVEYRLVRTFGLTESRMIFTYTDLQPWLSVMIFHHCLERSFLISTAARSREQYT